MYISKKLIGLAAGILMSGVAWSGSNDLKDFGVRLSNDLRFNSFRYLGIKDHLPASTSGTVERHLGQKSSDLVDVARGLSAEILTRDVGNKADMFSLFPQENPTHLVFCIEGGRELITEEK